VPKFSLLRMFGDQRAGQERVVLRLGRPQGVEAHRFGGAGDFGNGGQA